MIERTLNVPSDPTDKTRAFQPTIPRVCSVCHGPMWKKHGETCPGPRQVVAPWPPEPEPECPCVGAFHEHGCPVAYWPGTA